MNKLVANSISSVINYCVRWDSDKSVPATQREQIAKEVDLAYQKWFKWVYGWDNFPFDNVKVNVVGWAVKDKSLLEGSTEGLDIYTDVDGEGIPQCAESCGRFFHKDGDYSGCAAGADRHYDQSIWLTPGHDGGSGGDWGQRVATELFMSGIDGGDNMLYILHEQVSATERSWIYTASKTDCFFCRVTPSASTTSMTGTLPATSRISL